jgi:hypothetical protein
MAPQWRPVDWVKAQRAQPRNAWAHETPAASVQDLRGHRYRQILIAVDGSELAQKAVPRRTAEAGGVMVTSPIRGRQS